MHPYPRREGPIFRKREARRAFYCHSNRIQDFRADRLCKNCDDARCRNFDLTSVLLSRSLVGPWVRTPTDQKRREKMHWVLSRGLLPLAMGAALLTAGCATNEDVKTAQATADAARMQAEQARSAADMAIAAAQSAGQKADQATTTAQQAQQTATGAQTAASGAQTAADSAQASAQNAAASAEQAKDVARAADERVQQAERARPTRTTRLARGERG
jgi:hypothetical protein